MNPLNPAPEQAENRRRLTAQEVQQAQDLARLLQEHGQSQAQPFTSPWQVAGQWAQALSGKAKMADLGQQYAALNAAQPFGADTTAPAAPAATPSGPSASDATLPSPTEVKGTKTKAFAPEISAAIKEGAAAAGVDPNLMAVFAHIESGGRAGPEADTGKYKGLMQLSDKEMAEVSGGKGDVYNPKDSTMAAGLIAKRNQAAYEAATGKPASPFDTYMMHQQGQAGYLAHVNNPNQPAWQSMLSTGEGKARGEKWAQSAITRNGGHISDTSAQFLGRWQNKFGRLAEGYHDAFHDEGPVKPISDVGAVGGPGDKLASAAPTPAPGAVPGGGAPAAAAASPGSAGAPLIEQGTFVHPDLLPKPPITPYRSQADLAKAVQMGVISPEQASKAAADMLAAQQPQSMKVPGGSITWNPNNPSQQVRIPSVESKQTKVGDVETTQHYWVDSQGRQHIMPTAEAAPTGAPTIPGAPPTTPPGATPTPGATSTPVGPAKTAVPAADADPFPTSGSVAEQAAWGERRRVRMAGEEEEAKTQAEASTKTYNQIYTGITGGGDNAAHQAQNIQLLREIAPAAFTGTGANSALALNRMQELAARFGIKVDPSKAAPRELFNTLAARVLADQFSGMRNLAAEEGSSAGRIFKTMLDIEEKANITHEDTLDGVQAKLNMLQQSGEQMIRWADLADDYVKEHGKLDSGFTKMLRKDIKESKFTDILPKHEAEPPPAALGPASLAPRTMAPPPTGAPSSASMPLPGMAASPPPALGTPQQRLNQTIRNMGPTPAERATPGLVEGAHEPTPTELAIGAAAPFAAAAVPGLARAGAAGAGAVLRNAPHGSWADWAKGGLTFGAIEELIRHLRGGQ